jgi:CubicO group peptidase (beta-lactamase class C family)
MVCQPSRGRAAGLDREQTRPGQSVPATVPGAAGEFSWGGAASTAFWVDPLEELTVSFFTQLLPSSAHRIRPQLRQLVYQALID